MGDVTVVQDYEQSPTVVWRALTDPTLVPLWTSTGRGGRPEGFRSEVGSTFRLIGKPFPGWDGIVRCRVLAVDEPWLLSYDWRNKEGDRPTTVTTMLSELPGGGTRLAWRHTGFRGVAGLVHVEPAGSGAVQDARRGPTEGPARARRTRSSATGQRASTQDVVDIGLFI